jgi:hypothetical protein
MQKNDNINYHPIIRVQKGEKVEIEANQEDSKEEDVSYTQDSSISVKLLKRQFQEIISNHEKVRAHNANILSNSTEINIPK